MPAMTTQHLDDHGLPSVGYADALLDMINLPESGTVSMIILAYHGDTFMKAHFEPLTDAQLLDMSEWWTNVDIQAETYPTQRKALAAAAKRRWPEARIFNVPGCLCCNGIDSLLEYDCEL